MFVKNELKKFQRVLTVREDEEVLHGEDEEQEKSSREAFLKITLHFLRKMKHEELADCLQSSKMISLKLYFQNLLKFPKYIHILIH